MPSWVSKGSLAFCVVFAVLLVAMVGGASADFGSVATGQGRVLDATAENVLFASGCDPNSGVCGQLQIEDVATGALTDVPLPAGQHPVGAGRLIAGGALLVSSPKADGTSAQLNEWHDGTLTSLGPINSASFLAVAGDYAIWTAGNNPWSLYRLTISSGATVLVSSNAGNTENAVASNGDVVYWTYPTYAVHRWRSGVDSLISHAS